METSEHNDPYSRFRLDPAQHDRERRRAEARVPRSRLIALAFFAAMPWFLYFGLVFTAWWLVMLDGTPGNDSVGWGLLALALPCLFLAASVSRRQRRWIRGQFNLEMSGRRPAGSGGFLDSFLDWIWLR